MPGETTARGYGWSHQQERERWRDEVEAGNVDCPRCERPIDPAEPWDLGHDDSDPDKRTYSGPEHRYCNRSAGGEKGHQRRGWAWKPIPKRLRRERLELSVDPADL